MEHKRIINGIKIPSIMFGTFQLNETDAIKNIVFSAAENGALGFDTSPSYHTEKDLSNAIKMYMDKFHIEREHFFVQTKIDSWQMITKKGNITSYVKNTLKMTGMDYWDSLLIHWPQPEYFVSTWLCFENLLKEGLVRSIGVCNFKPRHFRMLEQGGASVAPMIVQNEIHPFNTDQDVVSYCQNNNILIQAYSPLCRMLECVMENECLLDIASVHNKSIAQIILRWHIERGVIPIVKTGNPKRISENLSVLDFKLGEEEIRMISALNEDFKIFLESRCCPGY